MRVGREAPRPPRASALGHTYRLIRRARRTRRRMGPVACGMGPAKKGVLQVGVFQASPYFKTISSFRI